MDKAGGISQELRPHPCSSPTLKKLPPVVPQEFLRLVFEQSVVVQGSTVRGPECMRYLPEGKLVENLHNGQL